MGPVATSWLERFVQRHDEYREAAQLARRELFAVLVDRPIAIHSIEARAKTPESAYAKIKRKRYGRPAQQMTDVIGARIITSYATDIERVVERLRTRFLIDEKNCIDKRQVLGISEFGYRSVHLVLQIERVSEVGTAADLLRRTWIEVQVRSIVEHAWAEAEHELRYKSGVLLPDNMKRRFNALAGALEIIDREFDALATGLVELVASYKVQYEKGHLGAEEFDSAMLLGYMAAKRPEAIVLGPPPLLLQLRDAANCVSALRQVQVTNADLATAAMNGQRFRTLIRDYADARNTEPEALSAPVIVAATVAIADPSVLDDFPGLNDAVIRSLVRDRD